MAIALVSGQTASGHTAASPLTLTLPNNPTIGNFVVVGIRTGNGTITVKDSNNNTYVATTKTPFLDVGANRDGIYYLANAPANATKTLTLTTTVGDIDGWAAEYSGVTASTPLENDATGNSSANNTHINSPSLSPTNDGDLLICVIGAGATITSANSPWTIMNAIQNGNGTEYMIQGTHASQAADFTQNASSNWGGIIAAFKAAASGLTPYNPWPLWAPVLSQ